MEFSATPADRRLFLRYCPRRRRILSILMLAPLLPFLTGTQMCLLHAAENAVLEQQRKKLSHEQFKNQLPQYLRRQLLPQLRNLALNAKARENPIPASDSKALKRLADELERVKISLMDSAGSSGKNATPRIPGSRQGTSGNSPLQEALSTVTRLRACCLHLLGNNQNLRENAILQILDITSYLEKRSDPAHLPSNREWGTKQKREQATPEAAPSDSTRRPSLPFGGSPRLQDPASPATGFPLLDLSRIPSPRLMAAAAELPRQDIAGFSAPTASGPPDAADLATSAPWTCASPEIDTLTQELTTPAAIFEYFRNEFTFEPYFGAAKGTRRTLDEKAGNDVDLASAMISTMRGAGIPCRYVYGTIRLSPKRASDWLGVAPECLPELLETQNIPHLVEDAENSQSDILLDHVWVKAYLDYLPYRGITTPTNTTGQTANHGMWVDLDPSFKQHSFTERCNLNTELGLNPQLFLANIRSMSTGSALPEIAGITKSTIPADDYVEELPQNLILNQILGDANALTEFMLQNNRSIETIFRKRTVDEERYGLLPCSDFYTIESRGACWSTWPEALTTQVDFSLRDSDGRMLLDHSIPLPCVLEQSLTLTYSPADPSDQDLLQEWSSLDPSESLPVYLVNVIPRLTLGSTVIATTTESAVLGDLQTIDCTFVPAGCRYTEFPQADRSRIRHVRDSTNAGSRSVFVFDAGKITQSQLNQISQRLRGGDASLDDLLRAVGLNYFYQADRFGKAAAGILDHFARRAPSAIRVTAALEVEELFGQPYQAKSGLIQCSVLKDTFTISPTSNELQTAVQKNSAKPAFTSALALVSSALEHNSLLQMVDGVAVSPLDIFQHACSATNPLIVLQPEIDQTGKPTGDPLTAEALTELDLSVNPGFQELLLEFLNAGHTIAFTRDPVNPGGIPRDAFAAVNPLSGASGCFLYPSEYLAKPIAGSEVLMTNHPQTIPDLVSSNPVTLPESASTRASDWLNLAPDATTTVGTSILPIISYCVHWFASASPENTPPALSLSALKIASAAVALCGRIEEDSEKPGIINVACAPRTFSPNSDEINDEVSLTATVLKANSWNLRIADSLGQTVRNFTSETDPRLINVAWDGRSTTGEKLPDGTYNVLLSASGTETVTIPDKWVIDATPPESNPDYQDNTA